MVAPAFAITRRRLRHLGKKNNSRVSCTFFDFRWYKTWKYHEKMMFFNTNGNLIKCSWGRRLQPDYLQKINNFKGVVKKMLLNTSKVFHCDNKTLEYEFNIFSAMAHCDTSVNFLILHRMLKEHVSKFFCRILGHVLVNWHKRIICRVRPYI